MLGYFIIAFDCTVYWLLQTFAFFSLFELRNGIEIISSKLYLFLQNYHTRFTVWNLSSTWSNFIKNGWASIKIFRRFSYFSRLSMIITTPNDNKPTHSVSSFVLKTNHAQKLIFSFLFSQCYGFYLSLKPGLHFFCTIINGNVIASFV